jgi:hypothetical protein
LSAEGKTTLADLLDALQAKTKEEMKVWLAGTSSARTFEDDADRATGDASIRNAGPRSSRGGLVDESHAWAHEMA